MDLPQVQNGVLTGVLEAPAPPGGGVDGSIAFYWVYFVFMGAEESNGAVRRKGFATLSDAGTSVVQNLVFDFSKIKLIIEPVLFSGRQGLRNGLREQLSRR